MFEIKNMRTKNHDVIKASFTVAFQKLDLNDMLIINGRSGMFVSNASRQYKTNSGETKYANYYFVKDKDLQQQIEEKALEMYHSQSGNDRTQNANQRGGGINQGPSFNPDDHIPFAVMPEFKALK